MRNFDNLLLKIGPVVKAAMLEAIEVIRQEAGKFVAEAKLYYSGKVGDVVTSADFAAQAVYRRHFEAGLPGFGLIGEEGLEVPCSLAGGEDIYITIDPLDGTKAYARRQAHGVGTMVGVVRNGRVIASFVGDVNSGDVYSFAPGCQPSRVHFGQESFLVGFDQEIGDLDKQYLLLNAAPAEFPEGIMPLAKPVQKGGLFKNIEISYGSYGLIATRLWNNEAVAAIFDPAWCTPWDETPVFGLNQKLGFKRFPIDCQTGLVAAKPCELVLARKPYRVKEWSLVTRAEVADRVIAWLAQN